MITWVLATIAARMILDLDLTLALLFGAILVVTGTTVIIPLLREIRPRGNLNTVLKWEGIMNDPVGALLAVLVFEGILSAGLGVATAQLFIGLLKTVVFGSLLGYIGARFIIIMLRRRLIPDYLLNPITLAMVFCVFVASNLIQAESGLFATTLMGITLANQKKVTVKHIIEFKENLRVLLITVLFIILAARLTLEDIGMIDMNTVWFLLLLVLVVRPVAVFVSTAASSLSLKEKIFLSWMAPRGIVAAAVTSVFAFELLNLGISGADKLVPSMFFVIVGTIAIYGLTARPLAKWLNIANPNPQGCLILGAHDCARKLGKILLDQGYHVLMVDTNYNNLSRARMMGLPTYFGSVLSEYILNDIDLDGIGRLLALTPNEEVNSLAALYFAKIFGSTEVYQLAIEGEKNERGRSVSRELRGQILFGNEFTYGYMTNVFRDDGVIKKTAITGEFSYENLVDQYGPGRLIPLFLIDQESNLKIFSIASRPVPRAGDQLIALSIPAEKS